MTNLTMQRPQPVYESVLHLAHVRALSPDRLVSDLLQQRLQPHSPHIDHYLSRDGRVRPVIQGTRVGVEVIVGYHQAGYTPQEVATDMLPQLTLAQIYAALSYYEDHREQMDKAEPANTPQAWKARLKQELGIEAAQRLLGTD